MQLQQRDAGHEAGPPTITARDEILSLFARRLASQEIGFARAYLHSYVTNVLTSSGNQDITLSFSGPAPKVVGFDSFTNHFGPPVVSVFDTAHSLIGSFTLTQGPSTAGFVGITSSVGLGEVRWLGDRGQDKDTGIDNVRVSTPVPEPQSWALMMAGLAVAGFVRRFNKRG